MVSKGVNRIARIYHTTEVASSQAAAQSPVGIDAAPWGRAILSRRHRAPPLKRHPPPRQATARGKGGKRARGFSTIRHPAHFARQVGPIEVFRTASTRSSRRGRCALNPSTVRFLTKLCGARRSERSEGRLATHSEFPHKGRCAVPLGEREFIDVAAHAVFPSDFTCHLLLCFFCGGLLRSPGAQCEEASLATSSYVLRRTPQEPWRAG